MNDQLYSIHEFPNAAALNPQILGELDRLIDSPAVRRSHFFHGRFENLYIPLDSIPVVSDVLCFARQAAAERLRCHVEQLRAGFWFNLMPPGAVTSLHSHEEDDELMSAAYYISVPDASGDLILRPDSNEIRITPREGRLVLFAPSLLHEVAENRSSRTRLSIGINIGPVPDA